MRRRTFLRTTVPAAAALSAAANGPRPNILSICTDQQRFNTITSLGNSKIRTPNLDRLARRGADPRS